MKQMQKKKIMLTLDSPPSQKSDKQQPNHLMPSPTLEYIEDPQDEDDEAQFQLPSKPQVKYSKFNKVNLQIGVSSDEDEAHDSPNQNIPTKNEFTQNAFGNEGTEENELSAIQQQQQNDLIFSTSLIDVEQEESIEVNYSDKQIVQKPALPKKQFMNLQLDIQSDEDDNEEEKIQIIPKKAFKAHNSAASKVIKLPKQRMPSERKTSQNLLTKTLVEGPEPSQDFSCKWVQKFEQVLKVERGIPLIDFERQALVRDLNTEFRLLRKLTETKEHLSNQEHCGSHLNRYSDLKPFKHTLVRLVQRDTDISDSYINANYINSAIQQNDQAFIATQGPLPSTKENFWRMILQENTKLIINLTKTKEHGKTKCDQYWPSEVGEGIEFVENSLSLKLILMASESLMTHLIRRKFKIIRQDDGEELREVIQLHYLSWPDHGAPEQTDFQIIRKLIDFTQEHHVFEPDEYTSLNRNTKKYESSSKIIFHCSAGIGRTGTMIAIYNIIEALRIQQERHEQLSDDAKKKENDSQSGPRISVFGVVRRLREQRYCMVQTSSQYEFIYQYILDYLTSNGIIAQNFERQSSDDGYDDEDEPADMQDQENENL